MGVGKGIIYITIKASPNSCRFHFREIRLHILRNTEQSVSTFDAGSDTLLLQGYAKLNSRQLPCKQDRK